MHPLTQAIKTKFTAAGLLSTVTGGLFLERARNNPTRPFLVINVITAPLIDSYGHSTSYDATIQFSLHATGADAGMIAMKVVTDVYDDTILSLSTGTNIGVYRLDEPMPMQEQSDKHLVEDPSLVEEWQIITQYVYSVK